jgi:asparagine synthase (glutamine-hydrolysing)
MCGIAGEVRFDAQAADLAALARMLQPLRRRGPDHEGTYHSGRLALGQRRLAIIDLSPRSDQPLVDAELGLVLVFNGTIYNYRELRQRLQAEGYRFFSEGDSEVILKSFHRWGAACVTHLIGMFAFALWDMHTQRLFMARDRLGIKPLYYTQDTQRLRFASNPQALLAGGGVDTRLDPIALHHHLSLHAVVPAPRTLLQGVRKLAPAHTFWVSAEGTTQPECYWRLRAERPAERVADWEWLERTQVALETAVARRLEAADVPVGVLLSGGLDSSLLVGLAARRGRQLRTFSIGFEDTPEEQGSEFYYSDQVVAHFGTTHQRYRIANSEVLRRLPEAVAAMAEPMVAQDAVAFYLLAEQVAREVKVVLSGQGADEVFGGYFWYPQMQADTESDPVTRFAQHYFDRDHAEFSTTVAPAWASADYTHALVADYFAQPDASEFMDQVFRFDVTTLIVDDPVKRVDNMTMAWGLEARVPFLDHELVELAAQMPPAFKLREQGKYPLKALARGLLPDSVIDRPKGYFPLPALKYVRGEFLAWMREVLLSPACQQRGLYNPAYVTRLLAAPDAEASFTRLRGSKLFHLALLELWLQQVVEGRC